MVTTIEGTASVRIELLGTPRLVRGEKVYSLRLARSKRCLITMLACTPGAKFKRPQLLLRLYGPSQTSKFRTLLSAVRNDELQGILCEDMETGEIWLDATRVISDVQQFRADVARAISLPEAQKVQALRTALDHYGDGLPFAPSPALDPEQAELAHFWLEALLALLTSLVSLGPGEHTQRLTQGLRTARAHCRQYPEAEWASHTLVSLLLYADTPDQAQQEITRFRKPRKGSVSPEYATLSDLVAFRAEQRRAQRQSPARVDEWIGDRRRINMLAHQLAGLQDGSERSRLLSLDGLPGVGKSRLAREASAVLAQDHAIAVYVVSLAGITQRDAALSEIIRFFHGAGSAGSLLDRAVASVARAVRPSEATARRRCQRTVLILDDADAVVDELGPLLLYLISSLSSLSVLITAPCDLACAVRRLVEPLSSEEARTLFLKKMASIGPGAGDLPLQAVARICDAVGGLPLGIDYAAQECRYRAIESVVEALETRLPPGLHSALSGLMARLSPLTQTVFVHAAAFPYSFTRAGCLALLDGEGNAEEIETALRDLIDRGIFQRLGQDHFHLNAPLKQVALSRLSEEARDRLMARVILFFLSTPGNGTMGSVAAEEQHNLAGCFEWTLHRDRGDLAWKLADRFAPEYSNTALLQDGKRYLQAVVQRFPPPNKVDQAWVLQLLATIYCMLGDYTAGMALAQEVLILADETIPGMQLRRPQTLTVLANALHESGQYEASLEYFDRVIAFYDARIEAEGPGSPDVPPEGALREHLLSREQARMNKANSLRLLGRVDESLQLLDSAWRILKPVDDHDALARCLFNMADGYMALSDPLRAHAKFCDSVDLYTKPRRTGQDRKGLAYARLGVATALYFLQRFPEAQRALKKAMEVHRQIGDTLGLASSYLLLARIGLFDPDHVNCAAHVLEAVEVLRETTHQALLLELAYVGAMVATQNGFPNEAQMLWAACRCVVEEDRLVLLPAFERRKLSDIRKRTQADIPEAWPASETAAEEETPAETILDRVRQIALVCLASTSQTPDPGYRARR